MKFKVGDIISTIYKTSRVASYGLYHRFKIVKIKNKETEHPYVVSCLYDDEEIIDECFMDYELHFEIHPVLKIPQYLK